MEPEKKKILVVIGGATASGKTGLAVRLAQYFQTEIISADSRQFYKEMSIGTARATEAEMGGVPHHFTGHLPIESYYSVGEFERDGMALLEQLFKEKDLVILTGGSGMYQKALCEGLDEFPETTLADRAYWEGMYEKDGLSALQEALRTSDPEYYAEVDLNNPHRLIRALSVCSAAGKPFSSFRRGKKAERPFRCIYIWLSWNREALYARIDQRVHEMMDKGLVEEARALLPYRQHTALQTVGYQELFDYFDGSISLEGAVALIQQNSRRYAKRQLTWSRRDGFWKHFAPSEWDRLLAYVQESIEFGLDWKESIAVENEIHWKELSLFSGSERQFSCFFRSTKKGTITRMGTPLEEQLRFWQWMEHEMKWRD